MALGGTYFTKPVLLVPVVSRTLLKGGEGRGGAAGRAGGEGEPVCRETSARTSLETQTHPKRDPCREEKRETQKWGSTSFLVLRAPGACSLRHTGAQIVSIRDLEYIHKVLST